MDTQTPVPLQPLLLDVHPSFGARLMRLVVRMIVLLAMLGAIITPIAFAAMQMPVQVIELPQEEEVMSKEVQVLIPIIQRIEPTEEALSIEYGAAEGPVVTISPEEIAAQEEAARLAAEAAQKAAEESAHTLQSRNVMGVYLTPSSVGRDEFFNRTIKDGTAAGMSALVFDVKGSAVFFDADAPMAKELGLIHKQYDLPEILRIAKKHGIYTIGRFIAVKDAGFTKARPDTMIANPKTGQRIGYEFIDPTNADALEYNRQVLCALAQTGIDEVNLDYIRFSTEQFGALGAYSMEEKSDKITTFVKMARAAIDECGPRTKLGVSTYAILGWNYEKNLANLGQDVQNWGELVDIVSPMAYPATFTTPSYYNPGVNPGTRMYYLVWRTLEGYKELLGENAWKIRPWIQGYGVTSKNMTDQMKAVTDAGLCGFTVWNADNAYGVTYKNLPAFKRGEECGVPAAAL